MSRLCTNFAWINFDEKFNGTNREATRTFAIEGEPVGTGYLLIQVRDVELSGHRLLINGKDLPSFDIPADPENQVWRIWMDRVPPNFLRSGQNRLTIRRQFDDPTTVRDAEAFFVANVAVHWREGTEIAGTGETAWNDSDAEDMPKPWDSNAKPDRPERFHDLAKDHPGAGRPVDNGFLEEDERGRPFGLRDLEPTWPSEPGRGPAVPRLPFNEVGSGPSFNIDVFVRNIRNRLSGNAAGWAFVVNRNGQEYDSDAGGGAILPSDVDGGGTAIGSRDFTPDTRVQIASCSKTITAIATLKLLEDSGILLSAPAHQFLPAGWDIHPSFEAVTLRHLLSHRSGLTGVFSSGLTDQFAQLAVELGSNPGGTPVYRNMNFTLFRYINPALWAIVDLPSSRNAPPVAAAFFYAVHVIERLFSQMEGAIGNQASTSPLEARPTRYYANANALFGIDFPNYAMLAGAAGWHMSARELAAVLAFLTYTENLIGSGTRTIMDAFRLGWREPGTYQGAFGDYLGHGGLITQTDGMNRTGVTRTAIMKFPIQVEAALVANSEITGLNGSAGSILAQAYDGAWS
ncbi:serine hydrolase domain-containing protein [Ruegeria sp. HKCCA6837]|uniref:serine hydrolase domain-containing protein n=1 Tax=Ruegeria sp. HKCCA6837 TaxID=2682989 RepID=UPI001489F7C6|nr:serine hydrolase domain-containing protein [Ruegeria sp. HKCCA6837]